MGWMLGARVSVPNSANGRHVRRPGGTALARAKLGTLSFAQMLCWIVNFGYGLSSRSFLLDER